MTRFIQLTGFLLICSFASSGQSNLDLRSRVFALDSLIHASTTFGLQPADYRHAGLDSMLLGQRPLDAKSIDSIAQPFFKDLRDGRQVPHFRFEELKISRPNLDLQVNFKELANRLIKEVPEVQKLLNLLRDSVDLPKYQKALLVKDVNE